MSKSELALISELDLVSELALASKLGKDKTRDYPAVRGNPIAVLTVERVRKEVWVRVRVRVRVWVRRGRRLGLRILVLDEGHFGFG